MRDPTQVDGLKRMEGESRNEKYVSRRKYGPRQADRKRLFTKLGCGTLGRMVCARMRKSAGFTGNGIYVERAENEDFGRGK